MEVLRTIGEQALPAFEAILASPTVNGLLIETDPILKRLWRLRTTMSTSEWERCDSYLADVGMWRFEEELLYGRRHSRGFLGTIGPVAEGSASQGHHAPSPDPNWSCETYDRLRRAPWMVEREGPAVIFTVLYDPQTPPSQVDNLLRAGNEMNWRVRFAGRPVAVAQLRRKSAHRPLRGGISIGRSNHNISGTVGGCVDLNGSTYAVTCGHVLSALCDVVQPSEADGGAGQVVGTCLHTTDGMLTGAGLRCRAIGLSNDADVALVKLDASMSFATPTNPTRVIRMADISEDENVLVEARSGVRSLKIGALALRRSIDIQGTVYCFKDLFELRHRGDRWATKGLANNPTRRGDSGAWVFRETPLENDWLGMVTAGDGPSSYAQFSELVMDWANSKIAARP